MRWTALLLLCLFLSTPVPSQARRVEIFLRAAYGNQREEFSVRRAGDAPAVFVPTGISSLAWHDRFLFMPDGLKFGIKRFDRFGKLAEEIPLDRAIREEGAILFGDIHVDSTEILLSDTLRGLVWITDRQGKLKLRLETRKLEPDFRSPDLIFRDRAGRLWIHDRNTRRMLVTAPGNPLQREAILQRMERPTVLPQGLIVSCHREADNRRATLSVLDREGRFLVPLHHFSEEEPMGPVDCLGTDARGMFYFLYSLRGSVVIRVISPSGRLVERSTVPAGLSVLLLARSAVLDEHGAILHLVPGREGIQVMRYEQ